MGNGRLVVPVDETALFEQAKAIAQHPRRDAIGLAPQLADAGRAVVAEHPHVVQRPGPGTERNSLIG